MTDRIYLARTACCVAVFALVWPAQWVWSKPNNAESHLAVDAPLPEDGPPGGLLLLGRTLRESSPNLQS